MDRLADFNEVRFFRRLSATQCLDFQTETVAETEGMSTDSSGFLDVSRDEQLSIRLLAAELSWLCCQNKAVVLFPMLPPVEIRGSFLYFNTINCCMWSGLISVTEVFLFSIFLPIRGKMAANDGSVSVAVSTAAFLLGGHVTQWCLFCGSTPETKI